MSIGEVRIGNFRSLTQFPNHEEALNLLKKLASHVKPIMDKRNWRVGSLEEFLPNQENLLGVNVNHGQIIRIRLRPHNHQSRFYDFDHLIGTMLHELTHIEFGPHDSSFYKLLDELNDEYDILLAQGFTGDGFFSDGKRVGEGISHNVSPALARQKALEAAEKRRKTERIMTNGGRKLGGGSGGYGLTTRELAAMAAERRIRDNFWCGNEQNRSGIKKPTVGSTTTRPNVKATTSKSSPIRIPPEKLPGMKGSQWTCSQCTFINRPMASQCDVCLAERPSDNGTSSYLPEPVIIDVGGRSGTKKPTVGSTTTRPNGKATIGIPPEKLPGMKGSQWTCSQCTFTNRPMASQCDVCLAERPPDNDTSSYLPEPVIIDDGDRSGIKKSTVGSTTTRPNVEATIRIPTETLPGMKGSQWTCSQCTFINRPMASQCDACLAERPSDNDTSSYSPEPVIIDDGDFFSDPFRWDCPKCTFRNAPDIIMCLGCDFLKN
ncbi:WLM domain-containing protein [Rhizophagus diaphanus]|nr:WLM domain-containing protein [Rhizophagus diaphanus] [Rhizophagus sp. MUCL 43196]